MKKTATFLLFVMTIISNAQQKINFSYDSAGNQIKRELCLSNCDPLAKEVKEVKEIEALVDDDLLKFSQSDNFSYYPNPVKEELYLQWELQNNIYITSIEVYSFTGQLVKSYRTTIQQNKQNIPFQNYSSGVYVVILRYNNGNEKSIKIIKQ
jgi:hypothetical protein